MKNSIKSGSITITEGEKYQATTRTYYDFWETSLFEVHMIDDDTVVYSTRWAAVDGTWQTIETTRAQFETRVRVERWSRSLTVAEQIERTRAAVAAMPKTILF